MTLAGWFRQGGSPAPPADHESLSVDVDGGFHLWRAVGAVAAGHFAGTADPAELAALRDAAEAAAGSPDLHVAPPPGAAVETAIAGQSRADVGAGAEVDGPWGALLALLRALAGAGVRAPVAAVALEVDADGSAARLVHRGSEAVEVDLGAATLRVVRWHGWYEPAGTWTAPRPLGSGTVTAAGGWELALPFDHGLPLGEGHTLQVEVDLGLTVAGNAIAAGLRYAPVPSAPH